jgi:hypothetical protein
MFMVATSALIPNYNRHVRRLFGMALQAYRRREKAARL